MGQNRSHRALRDGSPPDYSSEDFVALFEPSRFELAELFEEFELSKLCLLLPPPLLEELVFFLGLSDSSVSSVSLDALAVFDFNFDLVSPLEAPSSSASEAVLCFSEPL